MTVRYARLPTVLGELLVTDHGDGLSGVYFPGHRRGRGPTVADGWVTDDHHFAVVRDQLEGYLAGDRTAFDVPVAPVGTGFQREVWDQLTTIPYGRTVTYGELAAAIDRPGSARAVASAVGLNPLSIVVPCHRVVGSDRSLTGYAGGLDRKRHLLDLETGRTSLLA
jgi:methylated-DNA-[protein]-cysteine S-methyltransferase